MHVHTHSHTHGVFDTQIINSTNSTNALTPEYMCTYTRTPPASTAGVCIHMYLFVCTRCTKIGFYYIASVKVCVYIHSWDYRTLAHTCTLAHKYVRTYTAGTIAHLHTLAHWHTSMCGHTQLGLSHAYNVLCKIHKLSCAYEMAHCKFPYTLKFEYCISPPAD